MAARMLAALALSVPAVHSMVQLDMWTVDA